MYKLSVLVPSIRKDGLQKLYDSVKTAFSSEFEFIVIGPYGVPESMAHETNVTFIKDLGAPMRAQQIGLIASKGEYITWASDDGWYLPKSLDRAFELLKDRDYKTVIMGKYQEGDKKDDHMEQDPYYQLNNHYWSTAAFIPDNCWMLNVGVVSRQILIELGGWDADRFWCCPIAYNDLAVRLQKYGCKFIIQNEMMFECTHQPGETGDHRPIHIIQTMRDQPIYIELWNHPYYSKRLAIDINNWQKSPAIFENRFGRGDGL